MNRVAYIAAGAISVFFTACGGPSTFNIDALSNDDRSLLEVSPAVSATVPVLGSGWDTTAQRFKIHCVSGRTIEVPRDPRAKLDP
jgi:hypothetical protein